MTPFSIIATISFSFSLFCTLLLALLSFLSLPLHARISSAPLLSFPSSLSFLSSLSFSLPSYAMTWKRNTSTAFSLYSYCTVAWALNVCTVHVYENMWIYIFFVCNLVSFHIDYSTIIMNMILVRLHFLYFSRQLSVEERRNELKWMKPAIFHVLFMDYIEEWDETKRKRDDFRLASVCVCVWRGKLYIYTIQDAFGIFK